MSSIEVIILAIKKNRPDLLIEQIKDMQALQGRYTKLDSPIPDADKIDGIDPVTGHTPLGVAVLTEQNNPQDQEKLINLLLTEGQANLNAQDRNGNTALSLATEAGNLKMVRKLLESEDYTALSLTTASKETPLLIAARKNHHEMVTKFILATEFNEFKIDIDESDECGRTVTYWNVHHGHFENTKFLVEQYPETLVEIYANKDQLIHIAARQQQSNILKFLAPHMKDVNARNENNETAASLIVGNVAEEKTIIEILDTLTIHSKNKKLDLENPPFTPLMLAAKRGHFEVVEHLLRSGANVETLNEYNQDALFYAIANQQYKIAARLLAMASNPTRLVNLHGRLALAIEKGQVEMVKLLCVFGAKVHSHNPSLLCLLTTRHWDDKTAEENTATKMAMAHILLKQPSPSSLLEECQNPDSATPLILAAQQNLVALVTYFLGINADVNAIDHKGRTALFLAVKAGHTDTVRALLDSRHIGKKVVFDEISSTTDYNSMYAAVKYQRYEIADLLIRSGADPNESSVRMLMEESLSRIHVFSPFTLALTFGDVKMLEILLQPFARLPVKPTAITAAFAEEMANKQGPRVEIITVLLKAATGINWQLDEPFLAYATKRKTIFYGKEENKIAVLDIINQHYVASKVPHVTAALTDFLPLDQTPTLASAPKNKTIPQTINTALNDSVQNAIKNKKVAEFKKTLQLETKDRNTTLLTALPASTLCDSLIFAFDHDCFLLLFEAMRAEQAFMGLLVPGSSKKLALEHVVAKASTNANSSTAIENILKIAPFSLFYDQEGKPRSYPSSPFTKLINSFKNQATLLDYIWFVQQTLDSGRECKHQKHAIAILNALLKNDAEKDKKNTIDVMTFITQALNDSEAEPNGKAILCWISAIFTHVIGDQTIPFFDPKYKNGLIKSLKLEYARIKFFIERHFAWSPQALPPILTQETPSEAKEIKTSTSTIDIKKLMRDSTDLKKLRIKKQLFEAISNKNLDALEKTLQVIQEHSIEQESKAVSMENTVEATDLDGQTALMKAVAKRFLAGVQKLLAAGAWPWIKAKNGITALLLAAEQGDPQILQTLLTTQNVDILENGSKALYRVISSTSANQTLPSQRQACVALLLEHKVNANWTDPETGDTAIIAAAKAGFKQLLAVNAPTCEEDQVYAHDHVCLHTEQLIKEHRSKPIPVEFELKPHKDAKTTLDFNKLLVGVASDHAEALASFKKILEEKTTHQLPMDVNLLQEAFIYTLGFQKASAEVKSETTVPHSELLINKIHAADMMADFLNHNNFLNYLQKYYPGLFKNPSTAEINQAVGKTVKTVTLTGFNFLEYLQKYYPEILKERSTAETNQAAGKTVKSVTLTGFVPTHAQATNYLLGVTNISNTTGKPGSPNLQP